MSKRKRISKERKLNPTYFIFCEGETEARYIRYLRQKYRLPIEIDPKIAGQKISAQYIHNYKKGKFTHPKDRNYLVYDLDSREILVRLQKIKDSETIISVPCFEIWYLLHYRDQRSALTCEECYRKLKKHDIKYTKGKIDRDLAKMLDSNQPKAISRAKKHTSAKNPSSQVYKLIEDLEKAKQN